MTAPDAPVRRRSSLRTILVGALAVIALLVGVGLAVDRRTQEPATAGSGNDLPRPGASADPDEAFALPPMTLAGFADGPEVSLADLRGNPSIVNFWATWCAPCVREMPEFKQAADDFGDSVTILGVDVEDAPPNAEPFVERLGIDYPLAIDPQRELYNAVGNFGMPTTLFVDPDGVVQYRHTGPLDAEQLREFAAEHLGVES
jgi:thiol-disulfide isomerase/thioredoxin